MVGQGDAVETLTLLQPTHTVYATTPQIRTNTLHQVTCQDCGQNTQAEEPLLIYRSGQEPLLLYAPARKSAQLQRQERQRLVKQLLTNLELVDEDWLFEGLKQVKQPELGEWLNCDQANAASSSKSQGKPPVSRVKQPITPQPPKPSSTRPTPLVLAQLMPLLEELQKPIGSLQDHPRRIEILRQALELLPRELSLEMWAALQVELGNSLAQNPLGDRAENIESAIAAYQESLTVMTQSAMPVEWATTMMNLAIAYSDRIRGDKAENIESAIAAYQESLTVMTQSAMPVEWAQTMNNLATAYRNRIRGDKAENIESAIAAYQESLTIFKPDLLPNDCRLTARLLGNLYADNHCWAEAVAPYEQALEAAEILYQATLFRSSQEAELSTTNDLFRRAAYAQAQTGNLKQAVVTAEVGRARGLSETLERDRADLSDLETTAPALYQQYQQAVEALRQLEAEERSASSPVAENRPALSQAELRQRAETVRQQLKDAITAIRQHPGNEDFLDQPSFKDIAAAVQPDQPLVYLLPTANGSLALIVSQSAASDPVEIASIWLDTLTDTSLRELLVVPGDEPGGWFGAYLKRTANRDAWLEIIDRTTHQLWNLLMEPVVNHLKTLSVTQAILIPTGFLSFLPLHAAWTEDPSTPSGKRYAFDEIQLTYAPNARSLAVAQAIAQQVRSDTMLAIDEPKHRVKDKNDIYRDLSPLPNSTREVQAAISTFQNAQVLPHQQATKEAVLAALPKANVLHCSCHGSANLAEPLKSGLAMAGDGETAILTLNDLLSLKLPERETGGIRLAVLSACETGLSGTQLPDEVVSLPAGLLQAGVAGVAASLWSVSDLSTALLMVRFYDHWRNDNLPPAEALRQAQQWVRDTPNGKKAAYFKGFIPELAVPRMPSTAASTLYQSLAFADPDANAMAHPFYWAAFTYVGV